MEDVVAFDPPSLLLLPMMVSALCLSRPVVPLLRRLKLNQTAIEEEEGRKRLS